ncbi:MAG: hypothetical protein GXY46_10215 [Actinobacteria bacterium]|nr:hypothetical protein [Actinomycetota bacterium]
MIQVSEAASTALLEALEDASVPPEAGYRLAATEGVYKLRLDRPSSDDRVIREEERVVFMVEPEVDDALEGVVLDLKEGDSKRLTLQVV